MIKYEINIDNEEPLCFEIDETAPSELELLKRKIPSEIEKCSYPEWTLLDYVKCNACPLDSSRSTFEKYCPAAIALSDLIPLFSKVKSTEVATVRVYTDSKVIEKRVDVQTVLRVIFGLKMSLSGCPILGKFRVLGQMHLPFATLEETIMRTISLLVLKKFKEKKTDSVVFRASDLESFYREISDVNKGFYSRIKNIVKEDSSLNALVILNSFSEYGVIGIEDLIESLGDD